MDGRARFPEQGQPSKHRAGSRHGFAKVVSSGRSIVRKSLVLIEAGRIVVELPTGDRVERTGRLPGLIQRLVAAENFDEGYALTLREL